MKINSFNFEWEDYLLFKGKNKSIYMLNMPQIFSNVKSSDLKMSTSKSMTELKNLALASEKAELQLLKTGCKIFSKIRLRGL